MYKFLLSENRILFAITEDDNKKRKLASEISCFREYDNIVIALGVDKKSSAFYKICKTSLVKEKLVSIPRNINEFRDGMFSSLTYDEVIAIESQEPYLVYVVRKNCSAIEFAENQIDSLVVTDIETKETKAIYEWNVRGEAGCQCIGIPNCYETPEVILDDEWINVRSTFKKRTRDYWFNPAYLMVRNFKIHYDGSNKQDVEKCVN